MIDRETIKRIALEAFSRGQLEALTYSSADMELTITARLWHGEFPRRHAIDQYGYCIGHGPGSWDYVTGEFS